MYTTAIQRSGFPLTIPKDETHLAQLVNEILHDKRTQPTLIYLLFREWKMPHDFQINVLVRRSSLGNPAISTLAPYAAFISRVNLLWALGHSNPGLFQLDPNDRKDMEYCYYLPHCEAFASDDRKHRRLAPLLLRADQHFIKKSALKDDLGELSKWWTSMSKDDQIEFLRDNGNRPPARQGSTTSDLWAALRNDDKGPIPLEILDAIVVDSRLPEDQQVPMTFREVLLKLADDAKAANCLPSDEAQEIYRQHGTDDPTSFAERRSLMSRERILKLFPHLKDSDLD
jgi:hypothetical protein